MKYQPSSDSLGSTWVVCVGLPVGGEDVGLGDVRSTWRLPDAVEGSFLSSFCFDLSSASQTSGFSRLCPWRGLRSDGLVLHRGSSREVPGDRNPGEVLRRAAQGPRAAGLPGGGVEGAGQTVRPAPSAAQHGAWEGCEGAPASLPHLRPCSPSVVLWAPRRQV